MEGERNKWIARLTILVSYQLDNMISLSKSPSPFFHHPYHSPFWLSCDVPCYCFTQDLNDQTSVKEGQNIDRCLIVRVLVSEAQ